MVTSPPTNKRQWTTKYARTVENISSSSSSSKKKKEISVITTWKKGKKPVLVTIEEISGRGVLSVQIESRFIEYHELNPSNMSAYVSGVVRFMINEGTKQRYFALIFELATDLVNFMAVLEKYIIYHKETDDSLLSGSFSQIENTCADELDNQIPKNESAMIDSAAPQRCSGLLTNGETETQTETQSQEGSPVMLNVERVSSLIPVADKKMGRRNQVGLRTTKSARKPF